MIKMTEISSLYKTIYQTNCKIKLWIVLMCVCVYSVIGV